MAVPEHWWPGYSNRDICLGKLKIFDSGLSAPFVSEVEGEPGQPYGMWYDAILVYANVEHNNYAQYRHRLPDTAPIDPSLEVPVKVRHRRQ
jgi:hypothetical protein